MSRWLTHLDRMLIAYSYTRSSSQAWLQLYSVENILNECGEAKNCSSSLLLLHWYPTFWHGSRSLSHFISLETMISCKLSLAGNQELVHTDTYLFSLLLHQVQLSNQWHDRRLGKLPRCLSTSYSRAFGASVGRNGFDSSQEFARYVDSCNHRDSHPVPNTCGLQPGQLGMGSCLGLSSILQMARRCTGWSKWDLCAVYIFPRLFTVSWKQRVVKIDETQAHIHGCSFLS